MRSLHYLAFGIAFFGAQACASDPVEPPPFKADADPAQQDQAQTDNSNSDNSDEPSDPGSDEPSEDEPGMAAEPGAPLEPAACSVTFAKNVLPKIQSQWRCGASNCHGNPTMNSPVMDTSNATATYTLLTTFVHQGKKVVNALSSNANDSSLYCMMQGTCGARMPQQGVDAGDLALVKTWLECNAPK